MTVWKIKILYSGKIQIPKLDLSSGLDVGLIIDVPYLVHPEKCGLEAA